VGSEGLKESDIEKRRRKGRRGEEKKRDGVGWIERM